MPFHLVAAVTSSSWLPQQITVPGDDTEAGQRYAKTFANDHRARLDWSDKHELQILHLLSTSRRDVSDYNVPAEPLSVFLIRRSDGVGLRLNGERFDLVTDDGRQRRRDGMVLNERLRKIAADYEADIVNGTLYEALTKPGHKPPWLTATFAEELATGPWFNPDGSPCLLAFRVDVVAEDPDLDDPAILLDNVRRKEASIPTPLPALAKQYTSLLGAKRGGVALFPHITKLAEKIGKSPQHVRSVLDYEKLDPVLKDAVDKQTIGLGLAVVGPDCIAFVTVDGEKKPLPCEAQVAVYKELAATYAVELDDGIPDNKTTRKGVALIKERLGFGTAKTVAKTVAVVKTEAAPAETVKRADAGRSERIAERAAARLGIGKAEAGARDEAVKTKPVVDSVREREVGISQQPGKPSVDDLKDLKNPTVKAVVKYLNGDMTKLALLQAVGEISAEDIETVLTALSKIERHVGDLRSLPPADFDRAIRAMVSEKTYDMVVADIMSAYRVAKTRRHVDIGVHVREMLSE